MKFTIENHLLQKAVQSAMSAIERKTTLPILGNILLKLEGGKLTLFTSNSEQEASVLIDDVYGEDGEITVPAEKLFSILRSTDKQSHVEFNLSGVKANLKIGRSKFVLATLPADDYPSADSGIKWLAEFVISSEALKACMSRASFAMAQQDVRYYLNGMLFELRDNLMTCVATDGHRLALAGADVDSTAEVSVIIPRKMVTEFVRVITGDTVTVRVSSNHIQFSVGNTTFTSKLIDGNFPDYHGVIQVPQSRPLVCGTDAIKSALSRVSILSSDKYKGVRFNLTDDSIQLSSNNIEQEEAEEFVVVEYRGDEIEVGFNVGYLLDALNAVETEKVEMHFGDSNSSMLLMPEGDYSVKYVIMPMRL
jgi:DNA polymerase-3 subunit beta